MNTLDLRSLSYLLALAERANYARAADDLGISQPALSRAIQSLERQLDIRLFDRDRSGVRPTPQGEAFVARAKILVANARDLERHTALAARGASGLVRFGIAPMPARALLADALCRQIVAAPDLTNDVVVRNVEALWPLLVEGDIEFFISAEGQIPPSPPVRSETLGTFPFGFIVKSGHPLLTESQSDQTFPVLVSSGSSVHVPEALATKLQSPPHVIEDFETLTKLVAATDAVWVCSPFAVKDEIKRGTLAELKPPGSEVPDMRIVIYSLDRRSQSPAACTLRDLFRKLVQNLR